MIYAMYRYFENQLKEPVLEFECRRQHTMIQYAHISNRLHRLNSQIEHAYSKYEDTWDEETKEFVMKMQTQNMEMIDMLESILSG